MKVIAMYSVIIQTHDTDETFDVLMADQFTRQVTLTECGTTFDGLIELEARGDYNEIHRVCDILDIDHDEVYMNETS